MTRGERPSAEEALKHPFFSVDPAEVAAMVAKEQVGARKIGGGFFGSLFGGGGDELPAEGRLGGVGR